MQANLFHLHALSPLHCGTGQSTSVIDLPIARAKATQLPIVPGSSLRGVLREHFTRADGDIAKTLFGPLSIRSNDEAFAGALSIGDAHLLALPVRCLAGIVSYVTSPFILRALRAGPGTGREAPPAKPSQRTRQGDGMGDAQVGQPCGGDAGARRPRSRIP